MAVQLWSNVQVAIESARAAAQTISGISKANPGVVTYTGTDPANGDYVALSVQGMWQLDNRIVRVANVNAGSNTFEIEGVNTTDYDTFSSGSFEPVTFGTSLSVVTGINVSGGDFQMIDVTTIHDNIQQQIPGVASPVTISMEAIWDPSDAGLLALKAASDAKDVLGVKVTFSNGYKWVSNGYIGCTLSPTGQAQAKVSTPITITAYGRPSAYST